MLLRLDHAPSSPVHTARARARACASLSRRCFVFPSLCARVLFRPLHIRCLSCNPLLAQGCVWAKRPHITHNHTSHHAQNRPICAEIPPLPLLPPDMCFLWDAASRKQKPPSLQTRKQPSVCGGPQERERKRVARASHSLTHSLTPPKLLCVQKKKREFLSSSPQHGPFCSPTSPLLFLTHAHAPTQLPHSHNPLPQN
jgi:hypothetical protein